MITFFVCLALLIVGYIVYSRVSEKIFGADDRLTPAMASPDGVDKTPLPTWKAFLIELLNIAGTGPIFGAISGALFGPIAFLWIVIGCLLGGAVHDYFSGMVSSRNDGKSTAEITKPLLGSAMQLVMRIFSIVLLILVSAVFVVSPAGLLQSLTGAKVPALVWMAVILVYYFVATILPIDKVIGKAYPVFGVILVVMAIATIGGILVNQDQYPMLELVGNLSDFSKANGGLPAWPFMLTTIACGAVSGFHATQTPIMAKCIRSEKEGRTVFYGAMVAEGTIALIWAAAAMAFFKVDTPEGWAALNATGGNSQAVYHICQSLLGPVGTVLAVIGVVICPITSGDTALRSCRLIIAEWLGLDQKKTKNRILLTLALFGVVAGLSVWNFSDAKNFNILWRWFAWSNQILAALSLWISTAYVMKHGRYKYGSLLTAVPAGIMTMAVITYILGEPNLGLGNLLPMGVAYIIGAALALTFFIFYLFKLRKNNRMAK